MKITWLGHSSFLLETSSGLKIITDPYPQSVLAHSVCDADIVTVSHEHYDHNAVETLPSCKEILRGAKEWRFPGLKIKGYACWHDEVQGKKRGPNTVFVFETDSLKIAHMGDLGEELTDSLKEALQGIDCILIPVGGTYTVDGKQAAEIIDTLRPRYAVPMHYRIPGHAMDVLDDGSLFLDSVDKKYNLFRSESMAFDEPEGIVILSPR